MRVGETLDVKDLTGMTAWRPSVVVGAREGEVLVHYMGWESRWDEWIPVGSDRLQRFRGAAQWVQGMGSR